MIPFVTSGRSLSSLNLFLSVKKMVISRGEGGKNSSGAVSATSLPGLTADLSIL